MADQDWGEVSLVRLKQLLARVEKLLRLLERFQSQFRKPIDGFRKYYKQVITEKSFLEKMCEGEIPPTKSRACSSNVGLFESIYVVLQRERASLVGLGHMFSPASTSASTTSTSTSTTFTSAVSGDGFEEGQPSVDSGEGKPRAVKIDVVCGYGSKWVKVKAMNSKNIEGVVEGRGRYGERDVLELAQDIVACAAGRATSFGAINVEFAFADLPGISSKIIEELLQMNIVVTSAKLEDAFSIENQSSQNSAEISDMASNGTPSHFPQAVEHMSSSDSEESPTRYSYPHSSSASTSASTSISTQQQLLKTEYVPYAVDPADVSLVNLDITALIALTSDLSYGGCWHSFERYPVLDVQAKDEQVRPLLAGLKDFLHGKQMMVCELAKKEFESILETVGGEQEVIRGRELLSKCMIVHDEPSEAALKLQESQRVGRRQKIIFGTGDSRHAVTLTANVSFLRAASDQGVRFAAFTHPSRALTEQKRFNVSRRGGSLGGIPHAQG